MSLFRRPMRGSSEPGESLFDPSERLADGLLCFLFVLSFCDVSALFKTTSHRLLDPKIAWNRTWASSASAPPAQDESKSTYEEIVLGHSLYRYLAGPPARRSLRTSLQLKTHGFGEVNGNGRVRAYAAQWRGVSALEPAPPPHAHSSSSSPSPSAYAVVPPIYALHTTAPAPPLTLFVRYPSTITPTGVYLRAPTNGYAHAGETKRFVHLVGSPLDVALDARAAGGRGRWVRSGCWPNAEVRAFVCGGAGAGEGKGEGRRRAKGDGARDREREMDGEGEPRTHFGIFATRALRQGKIVVGWEWDDANAAHRVAEVAGNGGCVFYLVSSLSYHILFRLAFPL
ncbi:hypothetical protein B0H19DRAFT_1274790 [Mycena capillaripes]|nr:hypothetical protein B0H19DRAFT_1274790 [Mycena capillaripes]